MAWLARKLDTIIGAVFAAFGGMSCSQLQAFMHQYLQRLGGRVDEARRHLAEVTQGERYQELEPAARQSVTEVAQQRAAEIQVAYDTLRGADGLLKPVVFLHHLDTGLALSVLPDFQPAVPLDSASLVYAAAGFVVGLAVYELLKLPLVALRPPRRGARG